MSEDCTQLRTYAVHPAPKIRESVEALSGLPMQTAALNSAPTPAAAAVSTRPKHQPLEASYCTLLEEGLRAVHAGSQKQVSCCVEAIARVRCVREGERGVSPTSSHNSSHQGPDRSRAGSSSFNKQMLESATCTQVAASVLSCVLTILCRASEPCAKSIGKCDQATCIHELHKLLRQWPREIPTQGSSTSNACCRPLVGGVEGVTSRFGRPLWKLRALRLTVETHNQVQRHLQRQKQSP